MSAAWNPSGSPGFRTESVESTNRELLETLADPNPDGLVAIFAKFVDTDPAYDCYRVAEQPIRVACDAE